MSKRVGRLHVLTDLRFQQRFRHADLARLAAEGGADAIQFREKTGAARDRLAEARRVVAVCREWSVPCIVNDRLDIAWACRADGVHLGQEDVPVPDARALLGPNAVIGGTATTLEEALAMQESGADYVGFGPVFSGASKERAASVKGLTKLAGVCAAVRIPVVAIGGMSVDRVASVLEAGAHGVAVMTGVTTADDPARAARAFRDALDAALRTHSGPGG